MSKEQKLVSFIIISYNHAAYIDDCMKSVLNQTYGNMEILYMDDASSDDSFQKAEEYRSKLQKKYGKVKYWCNKENQGVVKNLNKLIPVCNGEYIKFLAADDFIMSGGIEDMVNYLEQNSQKDMIYTNGIRGDENTHFEEEFQLKQTKKLYDSIPPAGNNLFIQLYEKDFIVAPTVMIRKNTYNCIGLYDENLTIEDWDYFIRVALWGEIGYLDKCTVMYRVLSTSLSHSATPYRRIIMKKNELLILEKYKNYVPDYKIAKERIAKSYNEAISEACHLANLQYMVFLKEYAKKNQVGMTKRNKLKYVLYKIGIFRLWRNK